jgi:hypothetical protein
MYRNPSPALIGIIFPRELGTFKKQAYIYIYIYIYN